MTKEITAPLSGKIFTINIKPGDEIGDEIEVIIIEAMKMETSVYAPDKGTVKEVLVKVGDHVEEDDVLAIIE